MYRCLSTFSFLEGGYVVKKAPITCWKTECKSCRTEVFTFMRQRILIQHLANYCCVVSIYGLIVIVSCRTSKQDVDKNQSVTDLIIPNKKLTLLTRKELYDSTEIFPNGIYIDPDLSYVFVIVFGVLGRLGKQSFSSFPHQQQRNDELPKEPYNQ